MRSRSRASLLAYARSSHPASSPQKQLRLRLADRKTHLSTRLYRRKNCDQGSIPSHATLSGLKDLQPRSCMAQKKFDIFEIMQNPNIVNPSPKKSECRIISYKNHLISNSCVFLPGEFPKISPVKKHASIRTRPDSLSRSPSFRPGYSRGLSFDPSVCLKTHAMFSLARTDQEGQPSNSPGPGKHPMQGEAPDNPTRPHFLAQGSIPCSFSGCSGAFSHDTAPGMQGRAMPFPVQSTLSWTKVARDVAGILRGRAFQLLYSCKQVHKQFC